MRRTVGGAAATMAIVVMGMAVPSAATAAASPVTVNVDASARPWTQSLVGFGGGYAVISRSYAGEDWTLPGAPVKVPLAGGAATEIALEPGAGLQAVAGNDVVYSVAPFGSPRWQNLNTGDTGDVVAQIGFGATYGPHGASWVADDGAGNLHLYTIDVTAAADTAPTDLGALPAQVTTSASTYVLDDATAPVVVSVNDGVAAQLTGTGFQVVSLPALPGLNCTSVTSNALGCAATGLVVRLPLDGSAPQQTKVTGPTFAVAVTPTATAWYAGFVPTLRSRPAAGSSIDTSTSVPRVDFGTQTLFADGADFVGLLGSTLAEDGIYSFTDAASDPTLLARAGAAPSQGYDVAVTSGRVAWTDDTALTAMARSRAVTNPAGGPRLGSTTDLGGGDQSVLASGPWTLWTTSSRPDPAAPPLTTLHVAGATWTDTIGSTTYPAVLALSGDRVLYSRLTSGGARQLVLFDLGSFTSRLLSLTGVDVDMGATLWGDYVSYAKTDGSVWRRSLATGATIQVAPAGSVIQSGIREWADEVAWIGDLNDVGNPVWHWRDVAQPGSAVEAGSMLALTSNGALVLSDPTSQQSNGPVSLDPYGDPPPVQVVDDARYDTVSADADVLGWIDWSDHKAHVEALGHVPQQPRSLGAPVAPLLPQSDTWSLSLPTSAPLTTCLVKISQGATDVDTLDCDAAAMMQGVVSASWSMFPGGIQVAPGKYTWTVLAANGDGPLLAADGSTAAITGTVYSPSPVNITTFLHDLTVDAGHTVKLHATATGIPSPRVIWQVERKGSSAFNTIAGAASSTLTFTARPSSDGSIYQAIFDNGWTAAATFMHLTVRYAPHVTTEPRSITAAAGRRVTFAAAASANPMAAVHWQVSTDGGHTWHSLAGATSATLRLTARPTLNGNRYRAVFTNPLGTARSSAATLHVRG